MKTKKKSHLERMLLERIREILHNVKTGKRTLSPYQLKGYDPTAAHKFE